MIRRIKMFVNQFLIHKIEVETEFSTSWENIKNFVKKGMEELNKLPVYEKIYSRSRTLPVDEFLFK